MKIFILSILTAQIVSTPVFAVSNPECEKKIRDSGMFVHASDPRIACGALKSPAQQECVIELLSRAKGKLQQTDFFDVVAFCKEDPGAPMRQCFLSRMTKAAEDPAYVDASDVANVCIALKTRSSPPKKKSVPSQRSPKK